MTQMENIIAKGQLVPVMFTQDQVAASQSSAAMEILNMVFDAGTSDATFNYPQNTEIVIPWAFDVIGISVRSTAARTGGTLTVDATINGTKTGLTAVLNATNTQSASNTQARDVDSGSAGDRVGVKLTTDASWAPTTADIVVVVWLLVYVSDI